MLDGTAVFAIPTEAGELRIGTDSFAPALLGEADARRLGLAGYAVSVRTAAGEERALDLNDPAVRDCFHAGERREGLHYRWTSGDIVLPASLIDGHAGPLMLRVSLNSFAAPSGPHPKRDAIYTVATAEAVALVASARCAGIKVTSDLLQIGPALGLTPADYPAIAAEEKTFVRLFTGQVDAAGAQAWCDDVYARFGPDGTMIRGLLKQ